MRAMKMTKAKKKFRWIANEKARKAAYTKRVQVLIQKAKELTTLCSVSACLIFFSRDDKKVVAWPSKEAAKTLLDRFFDMPFLERSLKADDQESYIKAMIKKVEKKLADARKVSDNLEIDNLMVQIQNGAELRDLPLSDIEKLKAFAKKKMDALGQQLGYPEHFYNRNVINETFPRRGDEIPVVSSNVLSQWVRENNIVEPVENTGTYYLMDKWFFFDEPKDQKHGDDESLHVPTMVSRLNLNVEPSDDEEDMAESQGECSKAGGASDA